MLDPDAQITASAAPGADTKASFALSRLRRAFITCELIPGSIVAEPEIAERFFLGRAAVRSALARLEVEGYVRAAPRAGWQVAPVTAASVGEICNAWDMLGQSLNTRLPAPQIAASLVDLAARADALLGRDEPQVIAASRAVQREFMMTLGQSGGALIGTWTRNCADLTERLLHCFERSHPRMPSRPLTPIAQHLLARDGTAAAQAFNEFSAHLRAWMSACLIETDSFILQLPETGRPTSAAPHRPSAASKTPALGHKNIEKQGPK